MGKDSKNALKTTINLAQKEKREGGLTTVLPAAIILAICIGLFCKFGVVDRLNRVSRMEEQASQLEQTLQQVQEKTAKYDSVKARYDSSTAAQAALGGSDPMSCLTLIENNLLEDAAVSSFAVANGTISVKMSNVTLNEISVIYTRLKASSLVAGVKVSTAQSGDKSAAKVTATMTIQLTDSEEAAS